MTPPPTPLGPRARALLDAARPGLGPDPAAVARVHGNVLAGASAGAAGATGAGLAVKLTVVAVVAAVVGGGAWLASRSSGGERDGRADRVASPTASPAAIPIVERRAREGSNAPAGSAASPARSAAVVPPPGAAPAAPGAAASGANQAVAPPTSTAPSSPPSVRPAPRPAAPRGSGGRAGSSATGPGDGPDLAAEVALIDEAMAALRTDDPGAALSAAERHVARFGTAGQLAEEAAAVRVEALCRLDDRRAGAALDAFDRRWPRSAQRPRLAAACRPAP